MSTTGHESDIITVDGLKSSLQKFKNEQLNDIRSYSPSSYSGMGRVVLKKNVKTIGGVEKNYLEASMISAANTVYVIKYDYTLSANITMPANCVLEFCGGSLDGAYKLTGNNTCIVSPETKIFGLNIDFDGTFRHTGWNVLWFGAVADGVYSIQTTSPYNTTFTGTDNAPAIQRALDICAKTNVEIVYIPNGQYRLSKGVVTYYDGYHNTQIIGQSDVYKYNHGKLYGTVLLCEGNFGIGVLSARHCVIKNINLLGLNFAYSQKNNAAVGITDNIVGDDIDEWINASVKEMFYDNAHGRYNPYTGIAIDPYLDVPNNNTNYQSIGKDDILTKAAPSSRVETVNCGVYGFVVGYGYINNHDSNGDFNKIKGSSFSHNVYGVSVGNSQGRNFSIRDSQITQSYIAIDTITFGTKRGNLGGTIDTVNFDGNYNIINTSTNYRYPTIFICCSCESTIRIGNNVNPTESDFSPLVFKCCTLRIMKTNEQSIAKIGIPSCIAEGTFVFEDTVIVMNNNGLPVVNTIQQAECGVYSRGSKVSAYGLSGYYQNGITDVLCTNVYQDIFKFDTKNKFSSGIILRNMNNYNRDTFNRRICLHASTANLSNSLLSFDTSTGIVTIAREIGNFVNAVGDFLVNNYFSGIITEVGNGATKIKITNGYRYSNNTYEIINMPTTGYTNHILYSTKVRKMFDPVRVKSVSSDRKTLTLDTFKSDVFKVGRVLCFFGFIENSPQFEYNRVSAITAIDSNAKTITYQHGVDAYAGQYIYAYMAMSDEADYNVNATNNYYRQFVESNQ